MKMIRCVTAGKLSDFSQVDQETEIPVYGAQTDVGEFLPDAGIERISGWMILSSHQAGFDRFPLAALFECFHMQPSLLDNNNNYYLYYAQFSLSCQPFFDNWGEKCKKTIDALLLG